MKINMASGSKEFILIARKLVEYSFDLLSSLKTSTLGSLPSLLHYSVGRRDVRRCCTALVFTFVRTVETLTLLTARQQLR